MEGLGLVELVSVQGPRLISVEVLFGRPGSVVP